MPTTTPTALPAIAAFDAVVARRRAVGLARHAPGYLAGPTLLRPLLMEAIDATNYAVMEATRLRWQYPSGLDALERIETLGVLCMAFAQLAAGALRRTTGEHVDVDAEGHQRLYGLGADQYGFDNFLYRDNYTELVDECADAHILAGFEQDRRAHQAPADSDAIDLDRLQRVAHTIGAAAIELGDATRAAYPPPSRAAVQAA